MSRAVGVPTIAASRRALLAAFIVSFSFSNSVAAQEGTLTIGGTGSTLGTMRLLAAAFEQAHPAVTVDILQSLGSTGGIRAAISGAIALGVCSRPLSDAELSQGARGFEYGRAPLVFAVSRETHASDLTTAQVVDIYTGKLTVWPNGDPIRVVLRPDSDTDTLTLKALSPEIKDAVTAAEMRRGMLFALTDPEAIEKLQKIPGALAVTSLTELRTGAPQLKALKFNGVEPSPASIADGSYPLSLSFSLVTGAKPSALAEQFIAFVQSDQGRKILDETGHWIPNQKPER